MHTTRTPILLSMACATLALTAMNNAFASSYIHPKNSEAGYVTYPDHFRSDRTRAQVQAETAEFLKNGGPHVFRNSNYPVVDTSPSNKTRQQVLDELLNETPEQRKARREMYRG
ncbi:DUF4148 domain-containing protein [Comamonas sp. UBA7528]|jgi:hypothetical protein|uniref:DUF4148 domain-containing protein n=1 Tax=Comamonas sp. UBA7528 TaxID=1946391 RepID=UPI0025C39ED2|nr:DUF4148 domain-containing protein [Comamonas sp. UBA7528]